MTEKEVYELLDNLAIGYEIMEHEPINSIFEAVEKGIVLPGQQVKNLVLKNKKGRQYYLVILPENKIADISALAQALGEKRLSFANEEKLQELLGVVPGAVTPFGLLKDKEGKVQVIVDEEVDPDLTVGFHPFVNYKTLNMAYKDFERFLAYAEHPARRLMT